MVDVVVLSILGFIAFWVFLCLIVEPAWSSLSYYMGWSRSDPRERWRALAWPYTSNRKSRGGA